MKNYPKFIQSAKFEYQNIITECDTRIKPAIGILGVPNRYKPTERKGEAV